MRLGNCTNCTQQRLLTHVYVMSSDNTDRQWHFCSQRCLIEWLEKSKYTTGHRMWNEE